MEVSTAAGGCWGPGPADCRAGWAGGWLADAIRLAGQVAWSDLRCLWGGGGRAPKVPAPDMRILRRDSKGGAALTILSSTQRPVHRWRRRRKASRACRNRWFESGVIIAVSV